MVTVIMTTFNGADTLPTVLRAYCDIIPPTEGWNIIIVDNGSTDGTKNIINEYMELLPIRYVFEPRLGKNVAINTALQYIRGNLVVLTDDDAVPEPDWIIQFSDSASQNTDYSIFGGRIVPKWPVQPEDWLFRLVPLGIVYGMTDPALKEDPISPDFVWGANMAVAADVFRAGHRFDAALGPKGTRYEMGQETEFTIRMAKLGYKCWFCKKAVVHHIIREYQLEKNWILSKSFKFGREIHNRELSERASDPPRLFGAPRWMIRRLVSEAASATLAAITLDKDKNFQARWQVNYFAGYITAALTKRFES